MTQWWEELIMFEKLLYYAAIPATVILLIQTIMTFIGMGDDGTDIDLDGDVSEFDGDFEVSLEIFTVRNFIAFITFFGWGGLWAFSAGKTQTMAIILGFISGLAMMLVSAGFFYLMKKMTSSGNLKIKNAIGKTGEVYIPIPPNKKGRGKVQITVQDSLRELEAITADNKTIATSTLVKVVDIVNETVLVVERMTESNILKK